MPTMQASQASTPAGQRPRLWRLRPRLPVGGAVTLDRRHLYILPTRGGIGFGLLLLTMLLTSLNYDLSLGFGLTFLLTGMGMACMWMAYRNLLDLSIAAAEVQNGFAGQRVGFGLRVRNDQPGARIGIEATVRGGLPGDSLTLDGTGSGVLLIQLPAPRRGSLALPRVTLSSRFPFGLFRVWSHADLPMSALVYPTPEASPPPAPVAHHDDDEGPADAALPSDDAIDSLRRYRQGDPLHRIAWKHSARTGHLLTRSGQAARQPSCWLDWHTLPTQLGSEARLSRLCAWVLAAGDGVELGLRLPGVEIAPGRGAAHRRACLEALASWPRPARTAKVMSSTAA